MNILMSLFAICAGASLGASMRWLLNLALNTLFPLLPAGTLAANLLGAYCIGLAISFFGCMPEILPEWRLFVVTGFLGALTTFSSFSAEIFFLLQEHRFGLAFVGIGLHVLGSLLMTGCGVGTFWLFRSFLLR